MKKYNPFLVCFLNLFKIIKNYAGNIFFSIPVVISLLSASVVHAQTDTAFWFVAPVVTNMDLYGKGVGLNRPISLHIATFSQPSTVTISEPANSSFTPIVVNLSSDTSVNVDLTAYLTSVEDSPANNVNNYGIYIRATNIITVYYEVLALYSISGDASNPESFSLKGHNALGTRFYTPFQQTYDNSAHFFPYTYSAFDIVSSEGNTKVTITPAQDIVGHNAGTPFTVTLNRGQTFSCTATSQSAANHPSGSLVTSNNPVAITVKDDCVAIEGEDLEGDQIIPTNVTGNEYIVVRCPNYFNDLAIIVGTQNGTQVSVNGSYITTINAGQTYQYALTSSGDGADYITSSSPIYVYQLTTSNGEAGAAILPPLTCTGSTDVCVTRATSNSFYVFLITQNGNQGNFLCNGSAAQILSSQFQAVPGTGGNWEYAVVNLSSFITPGGVCRVINSSGLFSLGTLEGDDNGSSYAYFSNFVTQNNTVTTVSICNSDSALLQPTVSGTHLWNTGSTADSITVTKAGTYWVQNSLNGCLISDTFKVTTNSTSTLSIIPPSPAICIGKSVSLTVTNGTSALQWSPSTGLNTTTGSSVIASPVATTVYSVSGTNSGGCTVIGTDTVKVNPLPFITIIPDSSTVCSGQSLTLTASGGATYLWSPVQSLSSATGDSVVATPIIQTTYSIIGTDSLGCVAVGFDVVFVTLPPDTPLIIQRGDTLISTAKQGNQWARNDTVLAGATNQTYIVKISGEYKVVTQNPANGCSSTSDSGYYTPTGIEQLSVNSNQLSVYPNPTGGGINLNISTLAIDVKDWNLEITDVLGRTVYTKQSLDYTNDIDLSNVAGGVYFIIVINRTGRAVIPVMKQ